MSSKARLISIPLLLLLYSFSTQALSATTANTIKGNAPYIEQNGIRATDLNSLLSIKIGTKTYISDSAGAVQEVGANGLLTPVTTPLLTLTDAGTTFSGVSTLVPADGTSYELNKATVILPESRKDDDDDGAFTIVGNIKGVWLDKNNQPISTLSDLPLSCHAPYTLTLTTDSTTPSISTKYGNPNSSIYGNSSAVFKINPASGPAVCFAKPDMTKATGDYAGPVSMWDTTKGFITQSITPATYSQNFPTTGANGLYFELNIGGTTSALNWTTVKVGDITATPSACATPSIDCVKYTLTGPAATAEQIESANPGKILPVPTLPSTFELEGKDGSNTTVVKYGFTLQKWFIHRGNVRRVATAAAASGGDNQTTWCSSIGYHLSHVNDLTNASGSATVGDVVYSFPSADPKAPGNYYSRGINKALFSEWGNVRNFSSSGFVSGIYWTNDVTDSDQFAVYLSSGFVTSLGVADFTLYGMCTYP